jgi:hypothetical protein
VSHKKIDVLMPHIREALLEMLDEKKKTEFREWKPSLPCRFSYNTSPGFVEEEDIKLMVTLSSHQGNRTYVPNQQLPGTPAAAYSEERRSS